MLLSDDVHVCKIVHTNPYRERRDLRFGVAAVKFGPALLSRVVWDGPDETWGGVRLNVSMDRTCDDFHKLASSGRYAAVAFLGIGDGPCWSGAKLDGNGPAMVVVLDLFVVKELRPDGPVVTFPGADTLREFAAMLAFDPTHSVAEKPDGDETEG